MSSPLSGTPSFAGQIAAQAIAFAVFVAMPVFITFFFPFTDLEFRKDGGAATVTVRRFVLTFIPWQTQQVSHVKLLRPDITPAKTYRNNRGETVNRMSTAEVAIAGDGPEVIVQVAPALAKNVAAQFDQFLAAPSPGPMKMSVYANWSLSYIVGGIATFWCGFYVIGVVISLVMLPFK